MTTSAISANLANLRRRRDEEVQFFRGATQSAVSQYRDTIERSVQAQQESADRLLRLRTANNARIMQLEQQHAEFARDALNPQALKLLADHADIPAPTITSIYAGHEHALASAVDRQRAALDRQTAVLRNQESASAAQDKARIASLGTLRDVAKTELSTDIGAAETELQYDTRAYDADVAFGRSRFQDIERFDRDVDLYGIKRADAEVDIANREAFELRKLETAARLDAAKSAQRDRAAIAEARVRGGYNVEVAKIRQEASRYAADKRAAIGGSARVAGKPRQTGSLYAKLTAMTAEQAARDAGAEQSIVDSSDAPFIAPREKLDLPSSIDTRANLFAASPYNQVSSEGAGGAASYGELNEGLTIGDVAGLQVRGVGRDNLRPDEVAQYADTLGLARNTQFNQQVQDYIYGTVAGQERLKGAQPFIETGQSAGAAERAMIDAFPDIHTAADARVVLDRGRQAYGAGGVSFIEALTGRTTPQLPADAFVDYEMTDTARRQHQLTQYGRVLDDEDDIWGDDAQDFGEDGF